MPAGLLTLLVTTALVGGPTFGVVAFPSAILGGACSGGGAVQPRTAGEAIRDVRVEGSFFTCELRGINGRVFTIKDPTKSRILVVNLAATAPEDGGRIFAADFCAAYVHSQGSEDRAANLAVALAEGDKDDPDRYYVGHESRVTVSKGPVRFALAFNIEPDVEQVSIRAFGMKPVEVTMGKERPWGVFVTTNAPGDHLDKARKTIEAGGYRVLSTSRGLNKDMTDVTIHYAGPAEAAAREVSQRLMIVLGKAPTIKKTDLMGSSDLVVWLGKENEAGRGKGE